MTAGIKQKQVATYGKGMVGGAYNFKALVIPKKQSTIDVLVTEWNMTALHFKTLTRVALRSYSYSGAGLHRAIEYDLTGSFSNQYRCELRAVLKHNSCEQ